MLESDTYLLDRAGTILLGRYRVLELMDVGGMGSVWLAEQLALRQEVVVKFHESWSRAVDPELATQRFLREAKLLASVLHRNVTELFEAGATEEGEPFLIMERLNGCPLGWRMRDGVPLPLRESLTIAIEVASGLEAVHAAGVRHRDVKPENVFLHEDAALDRSVAKLLDFGLAGADGLRCLTDSNHTVGTPGYMPPEQARGLSDIDDRVDIYALAVTLYEMLAARLPAEGETSAELQYFVVHHDPIPITEHRADLPPAVTRAVMQALCRDRDLRPRDAREFRLRLQGALADLPPEL